MPPAKGAVKADDEEEEVFKVRNVLKIFTFPIVFGDMEGEEEEEMLKTS